MKTATEIVNIRLAALYVLADRGRANGLEITRGIEDLTDQHVDNERVYPALDDLRGEGFIEQKKRNRTRSTFWLTADGRDELENFHAWASDCLDDESGQQALQD